MRKFITIYGHTTKYYVEDGLIYSNTGKLINIYGDPPRFTIWYNVGDNRRATTILVKNFDFDKACYPKNVEYKFDEENVDIGDYLVFRDGRVFSKNRNKFLKPLVLKTGYHLYSINCRMVYAHRLVWKCFAGELKNYDEQGNKLEINHKDFNKSNNSFDNLELVTRTHNMRHARMMREMLNIKINTRYKPRSYTKVYSVIEKDYLGNVIKVYKDINEASLETKIPIGTIFYRISKGNQWDFKSFILCSNGTYYLYKPDKTYEVIDKSEVKLYNLHLYYEMPKKYYESRFEYGEKNIKILN